MSRISQRISSRINEAFSTVKCPGCGKNVTPTFATPYDGSESEQDQDGKRWSFIWRPPSGEVCPECSFPISRYAYRRKGWFVWIVRAGAAVAIVTTVVGLVGIVIGGRHGTEPSSVPLT
jgi:hypothetical protein